MKTPIHTERLTIRPLLYTDLDAVLAFTGLPETFSYIPEEPMNEQTARSMIERGQNIPDRDDILPDIAVTLIETGELVGLLSCYTISSRFRALEIGWMFHPAYRGNGYASEAAHALVHHGFRVLGLHRIIATCDLRSTPRVRITEKLGMRREDHLYESVLLADGKLHDAYYYAITDKDWLGETAFHEPRAKPQRPPDLTSLRESACHYACLSGCPPYVFIACLPLETTWASLWRQQVIGL